MTTYAIHDLLTGDFIRFDSVIGDFETGTTIAELLPVVELPPEPPTMPTGVEFVSLDLLRAIARAAVIIRESIDGRGGKMNIGAEYAVSHPLQSASVLSQPRLRVEHAPAGTTAHPDSPDTKWTPFVKKSFIIAKAIVDKKSFSELQQDKHRAEQLVAMVERWNATHRIQLDASILWEQMAYRKHTPSLKRLMKRMIDNIKAGRGEDDSARQRSGTTVKKTGLSRLIKHVALEDVGDVMAPIDPIQAALVWKRKPTLKQLKVVALLRRGLSFVAIADRLAVSEATIRQHVAAIKVNLSREID